MLHEEVLVNMRVKLPRGSRDLQPDDLYAARAEAFQCHMTGYSSTIEGISCSSLVMGGSLTTLTHFAFRWPRSMNTYVLAEPKGGTVSAGHKHTDRDNESRTDRPDERMAPCWMVAGGHREGAPMRNKRPVAYCGSGNELAVQWQGIRPPRGARASLTQRRR